MARKQLLANMTHLGLMQVTNYLVPLVAIPILLDRVGLAKYGIIALAVSVSNVFVTVTDYGYDLTGTREVSKYREDSARLQAIAAEILQVRLLLLVPGFLLLLLLTSVIPTWRAEAFVFLSTFLLVIAQGLFPVWYFQGIERMEFLTVINFLARITYLVGILTFVVDESDYVYVPIINGLAWMLTTGISLFLVLRRLRFGYKTLFQRFSLKSLRANFPIFLSLITAAVHRNSALIIGGVFFSGNILGLFAIIDKVLGILALMGTIAFRALFSRVSELSQEGYERVRLFLRRIVFTSFLPTVLAAIVLGAFGPFVIEWLTDVEAGSLKTYFLLVAIFPFLLLFNLPVCLALLSFNFRRHYFIYNISGMLAMVLTGIAAAYLIDISGLIIATLVAELTMLLVGIRDLRREFLLEKSTASP